MKILFIGAGASFGARVTFERKPPLGPILAKWLGERCREIQTNSWLMEFHRVVSEALQILESHKNETNYEKIIACLSRDERIALQRLLQLTFSDLSRRSNEAEFGFQTARDGYDHLIDVLEISESEWGCVSLNYDLLLEEAIQRKGLKVAYPVFPHGLGPSFEKAPGIKIYKPHGSINFFAHADFQVTHREPSPSDYRGQPVRMNFKNGSPVPNYPIIFAGLPGADNVLTRITDNFDNFPVMANYAEGKNTDVNDETLEELRTKTIEVCKVAEEIIIVGVNPLLSSVDDPIVSEILGINYSKLTYISPDRIACEKIQSIFKNAKIHHCGMAEYVEVLRIQNKNA